MFHDGGGTVEGGGLWWRGIISIIRNIVILKFHPTLDQKTQTKPPTNIYTRKQRIPNISGREFLSLR